MDEFGVILKAREFIRSSGISSIPVDLEKYAAAASAIIKIRHDLEDCESGQTFPLGGNHVIVVNGNHREERQRFTVLHEIAHIVLDLPSQHYGHLSTSALESYRGRPKEEVLCDIFAAECLLPFEQFKRDVEEVDPSFEAIKEIASDYKASVTATGSRFAVNSMAPCAFVLMERGKVRYVAKSKFLRELNGWIDIGIPIPKKSVAFRITNHSDQIQKYDELPTDIWFSNGVKGFQVLAEEAMHLKEWNQCLSILWFGEDLEPERPVATNTTDDENPLLEELDGILPWPSKKKRK